MTVAIVMLSILSAVLATGFIVVAPALMKKALANGEELLKERAAKMKATDERDALGAKLIFETARAEEAEHALSLKQKQYNSAVEEIVALEAKVAINETTEEITARINRRIAAIANPLEVPE